MHNFDTIEFVVAVKIARITLNRPDAANGLNMQMSEDLRQAAVLCDTDPSIKAVVLTTNGRFFCASGDLKAMVLGD